MNSRIFALLVAVGVGVGIGIGASTVARMAFDDPSINGWSQRAAEAPPKRLVWGESSELDPEQVAQVMESLIQTLDEEISERHFLAARLEEVRSEMTELQQNLRARFGTAFPGNASNTASPQPGAPADQTIEERLAASGFTPQQIRTISRRVAETQMQQIELDDRARREGWITTSRYFEEFNNLVKGADTVRRDLGDDAYSHFLFAIGRPNRLTVGMVIETSPAEQAGLHLGDVIRSYAGERVFSSAQLTRLRSSGDKDMPVILEIVRDGEPMQIWIPRGPMGIQIQQNRVDPSEPGGG